MAQAAAVNEFIYQDNLAYNGVGAAQPWQVPEEPALPKEQPREKPRRRAKEKARVQTKYGVSAVGIVGFVVAAVLIIAVLVANIRYTEVAASVVELQNELDELTESEKKLKIQYEQAFDINEIESYAVGTLHMSRPASDQIVRTGSISADRGEVLSTGEENGTALSRLGDFFGSLLSYFK